MFRLELLENIFSLLFLTYSDFAEVEKKQSSSIEENGEKGACKEKAESSASVGSGPVTPSCRGFLLDPGAMEGVLRLLKEGLEGMCAFGRALEAEAELAESLGCSVTVETFSSRLQRLSKHTAEAQWRLQIVTTNQGNGSGGSCDFIQILNVANNTWVVITLLSCSFWRFLYCCQLYSMRTVDHCY